MPKLSLLQQTQRTAHALDESLTTGLIPATVSLFDQGELPWNVTTDLERARELVRRARMRIDTAAIERGRGAG